MMKEGYLYEKLEDNKVRCNTCSQRCLILEGKRGICGTRENIDGKLYSLVYGKAIAEHVDPIEKKPLFHFLPGSFSLSVATAGCCFKCAWCQNWEISQQPKSLIANRYSPIEGFDLSPEKIVEDTKRERCQSISYTYTEPSIFLEYALDTMKLAKKEGISNNWVSDGYMTAESLDLIAPFLSAINVDLKAFDNKTYLTYIGGKLEHVLDNLKDIYRRKIHLEITTLIIPGLNDSDGELLKIAQFIKNKLGPEVPWHISRFFPAYKMINLPPTPIPTLEKAYEIGKKAGLRFVYLGNVSDPQKESTYCPKCGELVISRSGYVVEISAYAKGYGGSAETPSEGGKNLKNGKCGKCGEDLNIRTKQL